MDRPDLLAAHSDRLSRTERLVIRFVRRTLEPGAVDATMRWFQKHVGAAWINQCTRNVRHAYGTERLPELSLDRSFVCVSNHRSFFDMYVITGHLMKLGLPHRIMFPVRSRFFYDNPLGLLVNGSMSFFAMYPPIFRERKRLSLNVTSLDEVIWMLKRGGTFVGFHPEGTRKQDDDPYTLLPARPGVGRLIREANVTVVPAFINGLTNELWPQLRGNFTRSGKRVIIVFGEPIDFADLYAQPASPRLHRAIAQRCLDRVAELGQEERRLRASLGPR